MWFLFNQWLLINQKFLRNMMIVVKISGSWWNPYAKCEVKSTSGIKKRKRTKRKKTWHVVVCNNKNWQQVFMSFLFNGQVALTVIILGKNLILFSSFETTGPRKGTVILYGYARKHNTAINNLLMNKEKPKYPPCLWLSSLSVDVKMIIYYKLGYIQKSCRKSNWYNAI